MKYTIVKKGGSSKNWIQKAVNPAHKGYCTPMTKETCTPKRKALAKTFKKMAKKEMGGEVASKIEKKPVDTYNTVQSYKDGTDNKRNAPVIANAKTGKKLIPKNQKGAIIPPMVNDNTFVYKPNKPNLRGPHISTPEFIQNANIVKALPAFLWEKLNVDLPFNALNGLARIGEKLGATANPKLWPKGPNGTKLSPAQYQKSLLTKMQDKRWNAIKEGNYLGQPSISWRYKDGGKIQMSIDNILALWKK